MKYNACCLNCENRCMGCHSNCEMYNMYKKELATIKKNRNKDREWTSYRRQRVRGYCV